MSYVMALVIRILPDGLAYAAGASSVHSFTADQVVYQDDTIKELGITLGSPVRLNLTPDNQVASVELLAPSFT